MPQNGAQCRTNFETCLPWRNSFLLVSFCLPFSVLHIKKTDHWFRHQFALSYFQFLGQFDVSVFATRVYKTEWSFRTTTARRRPGIRHHARHVFDYSLFLGVTDLKPEDVTLLIGALLERWQGDRYNFLANNCQHFADFACEFALQLHVSPLPPEIHREYCKANSRCLTSICQASKAEMESFMPTSIWSYFESIISQSKYWNFDHLIFILSSYCRINDHQIYRKPGNWYPSPFGAGCGASWRDARQGCGELEQFDSASRFVFWWFKIGLGPSYFRWFSKVNIY